MLVADSFIDVPEFWEDKLNLNWLGKLLEMVINLPANYSRLDLYTTIHKEFKQVKHIAWRPDGRYTFIFHDHPPVYIDRVLWRQTFGN